MEDDQRLVRHPYDRFNAREVDGVRPLLTDELACANGMEGGNVYGHAAVRVS